MIKNIIIIILIFGFVAIVIFLDIPTVQKILNFKKEIEVQNNFFIEKQAFLEKVEKLRDSYQTNEETLKKLEYILPDGQDVPNLIVQVEAFANEGGLSLKKIDFLASENKEYQILTINLGLSGSYFAFKNFLKIVEDNIRLMDMQTVNFSPKSGIQTSDIDFEITLRAYYYQ